MDAAKIARNRFSERMRVLRRQRNATQRQLAAWTGRTQARISSVETDGDPQLSTIIALTGALRAELVPVPQERLDEVERLLGLLPSTPQDVPSPLERFFISAANEDDDGDQQALRRVAAPPHPKDTHRASFSKDGKRVTIRRVDSDGTKRLDNPLGPAIVSDKGLVYALDGVKLPEDEWRQRTGNPTPARSAVRAVSTSAAGP